MEGCKTHLGMPGATCPQTGRENLGIMPIQADAHQELMTDRTPKWSWPRGTGLSRRIGVDKMLRRRAARHLERKRRAGMRAVVTHETGHEALHRDPLSFKMLRQTLGKAVLGLMRSPCKPERERKAV